MGALPFCCCGGSNVRLLDFDTAPRRWHLPELAALVLWFAVAGFALRQHVSWADEVQAWFLAGSVSWSELFRHALHYEGEGGLWHTWLKLLQALHFSFPQARWATLAAEGAGMAILLRWSPFPLPVRLLLPFTFFLLYQDGVVTRSYCLFAPLAFGAAALLRAKKPRPVALAFLLGLLAMISVHGVILSAGLALAAWLHWRRAAGHKGLLMAAVLLGLFWLGTAATMSPAYDIDFPAGNNLQRSETKIKQALGLHPRPAPPKVTDLPMAGLAPPAIPVHIRHGSGSALNRGARVLGVLTYPVSSSRVLALAVIAAVLLQGLQGRRSKAGELGAIGLLPYACMVLVFTSLYLEPRHTGTLFTAFLVTAWLTWPAATGLRRQLARVTALLLIAVALVQIGWTARTIARERTQPYSPGAMTAVFLHAQGIAWHGEDRPIAGFYYYSIEPLTGFDRNLYFNQPPHRYWLWSTSPHTYMSVQQVLARQPRIVVVGGVEGGPDAAITRDWTPNTPPLPGVVRGDGFHVADFFEAHGYRVTHVFCGHRWMRASYDEQTCETILQR